jgi:hypothetical protein
MAVNNRKIVLKPVEGSPYRRMTCSRCNGQALYVEFGQLRKPQAGKKK